MTHHYVDFSDRYVRRTLRMLSSRNRTCGRSHPFAQFEPCVTVDLSRRDVVREPIAEDEMQDVALRSPLSISLPTENRSESIRAVKTSCGASWKRATVLT